MDRLNSKECTQMERVEGGIPYCAEKQAACDGCKSESNPYNYQNLLDLVSAYRATGLTPERAQELSDAERDGRLWVAPVKVGDIVYAIKGCFYLPHAIYIKHTTPIQCEVRGIKQTAKGVSILLKPLIEEAFGRRSSYKWFGITALDKTVFLTREAAEKALKEASDNAK